MCNLHGIGQSNRWYIGESFLDLSNNQPTSTIFQPGNIFAQKSWNMRHDHNLDLSFYVDNDEIYNSTYTQGPIGRISGLTSSGLGSLSGYSEICIVPVPGSCSKYFIVTAYPYYSSNASSGTNPQIVYVEIDMANYNSTLQTYGVISGADPFGNVNGTIIPNDNSGAWINHDNHCSQMHLAASQPLATGDRFLLISTCGELYKCDITSTGIGGAALLFDQATFAPGTGPVGSSTSISELELWQSPIDQSGNTPTYHYLIAAPIGSGSDYISLTDVTQNLVMLSNIIIGPLQNGSNTNPLKGIEFSQDGAYLYVSTNYLPYLRCYSTLTGASVALPLINQNDVTAFNLSMIETGIDQNLYLICPNYNVGGNTTSILGKISNPNNPSTATFNPSYFVFGNSHTAGLNGSFTTQLTTIPLNVLPDQIDGENYLDIYNQGGRVCCEATTDYDARNYTVQDVEIWDQNQTPFNNTGLVKITELLEIPSGATLTLRGVELNFGENGKIIIHPGGTLLIEGSKLTGNHRCETMWQGIEVWGDLPSNVEGFLSIKPDAFGTRSSIEQAIKAISFRDNINSTITNNEDGGRLLVEYTDFINNYDGIIYESHPINGQSSIIKNCSFSCGINSLWYPLTGQTSRYFINAKDVTANELKIIGTNNSFNRAYCAVLLEETNSIQINDAAFMNCTIGVWSLRGINSGLPTQTDISFNNFTTTHTSIKLDNGVEDQIGGNTFNASYTGTFNDLGSSQIKNFYGVYMNNTYGFRIVDNVFNHIKYGVYVINSGVNGGVIDANNMGNFFNECWRGVHTEQDNQALQIRCNTFNNVIQPASSFSKAWVNTGDLPNQGKYGVLPSDAAGNYFYRSGIRTDLYSLTGFTANSCNVSRNFCYFRNQTPSSVIPLNATPSTIDIVNNFQDQIGCGPRQRLMELAENDPEIALNIIEAETDIALKSQYSLELQKWYINNAQLDSLVSFLYSQDDQNGRERLYFEWLQRDSLVQAEAVLNSLHYENDGERQAFADLNMMLLNLRKTGQSIYSLDSGSITLLQTYAESDLRIANQSRSILFMLNDVLIIPEEISDTSSMRIGQFNNEAINNNWELRLVENPVLDNLQIEFLNIPDVKNLTIEIISLEGKLISTKQIMAEQKVILNCHYLCKGQYFIRTYSENHSYSSLRFHKL